MSHAIPGIALCGIDISVAAISQARRELEARGIVGVRLEVGGGEALTAFGSRSIDIVIADAVLTYIPPRQIIVVINEMLRVARKGIILGTWHFEPDSSGKPWLYDEGAWVYDYRRLLGRYSGLAVSIVPYPEDVWTDARWNRYGVVLTARFG